MSHNTPSSSTVSSLPLKILLSFAAIYLIWGSTYLAIRIAVETLPPFLMAGVRCCLAGGLLYGAMRLAGTPRPSWTMWKSAALVGGLMMFGGNGLVTWAQQTVPSGLTALAVATIPMWMVILDVVFCGAARPPRAVVLGLVVGTAGLIFLIGPSEGAVPPLGALVLTVAAVSWAVGSLLNRTAHLPSSPWMAAAMEMIAGGVLMVLAATATGEWSRLDPSTVSLRSVGAFFYLTVFGSIVALSAYVYLLRETSAAAVATYAFVNPVIALGLGWATGEVVSARTLVGAVLIVGSVVLIHWAKRHASRRPVVAAPVEEPGNDPGPVLSGARRAA